MNIPFNPEVTYLAQTNYRGAKDVFGIKRKDRRQHMYILGKSGTGKSQLIANMVTQDIRNGYGVCVVDPHGELVEEDILPIIPPERLQDVVYFNPADQDAHIGFNVLEIKDPQYKHLVASGLMGIFTKIWANAWSARMEYILSNAILALLDTPGSTLLGIPRLLVDSQYRKKVIDNITDPVVKSFWVYEYETWPDKFQKEAIAPIQNKVGQFLSTSIIRNIVGQAKSTIDVFDIMNNEKIFLVNVSKGRIGEDNSRLLGGMIITKLQLAAMERVRIPEHERKDFYLYVDEFQNFATESFASILSEARKYRLCLTLAHQYIAQLETPDSAAVRDAVFGNVGTMIVFRIGAADAEFLKTEFEPEFYPEDFVVLPNWKIYTKLMIDGVTSRPFSAATLPPLAIRGDDIALRNSIVDTSRQNFSRSRQQVEHEISNWTSGSSEGSTSGNTSKSSSGSYIKGGIKSDEQSEKSDFQPVRGVPHHAKVGLAKLGIEYPYDPVNMPPLKKEIAKPSHKSEGRSTQTVSVAKKTPKDKQADSIAGALPVPPKPNSKIQPAPKPNQIKSNSQNNSLRVPIKKNAKRRQKSNTANRRKRSFDDGRQDPQAKESSKNDLRAALQAAMGGGSSKSATPPAPPSNS